MWQRIRHVALVTRLHRLLSAYSSFLKDSGDFVWWFGMIIYPLIGSFSAMSLAFLVHPLAIFIPMIPPFALAIREDLRRDKVLTYRTDGIEISSEKQAQAIADYVALVHKRKEDQET